MTDHRQTISPTGGYVLSIGHGASGTKRVFNVIERSRRTHCRWGPHLLPGTPFKQLPDSIAFGADEARLMEQHWDAAVEWSRGHVSAQDVLPPRPKSHLRPLGRYVAGVLGNRHVRNLGGKALAVFRRREWAIPAWLGRLEAVRQATLMLRMGKVPAWTVWALQHRPQAGVMHIVRHPVAYLHAWRGRWASHKDLDQVSAANRERLVRIGRVHPEWAERFGRISDASALETELWFWRYATETIHEAGVETGRYALVKDEEIVTDPIGTTRWLYAACGLPWEADLDRYLTRKSQQWRRHTARLSDLMDEEIVGAMARVMRGSTIEHLWDGLEVVSLHTYAFR